MKYFILILLLTATNANARLHVEDYYRDLNCDSLYREIVLDDRTRVDCLTPNNAIEVEFADKWYEAIGQALHYSRKTNKQPKILLIVESYKDLKYVEAIFNSIIYHNLNIEIDIVYPKELE